MKAKDLILQDSDENFLAALAERHGFTTTGKGTFWKEVGPLFLHLQFETPTYTRYEAGRAVMLSLIYSHDKQYSMTVGLTDVPKALAAMVQAAESAVADPRLDRSTSRFGKTAWDRWQRLLRHGQWFTGSPWFQQ